LKCNRCGRTLPEPQFEGYHLCRRCRTIQDELAVLNARPGSRLAKVRAAVELVESLRAERTRVLIQERRGHKYNFSREQLRALTEAQQNRCAICDCPPDADQVLHLDHDHESGEARGLLCMHCNIGIGFLRDDPDLLERAYDYLINPPADEIR
jgi:hypothetical protein